jgi:hypothetical protein
LPTPRIAAYATGAVDDGKTPLGRDGVLPVQMRDKFSRSGSETRGCRVERSQRDAEVGIPATGAGRRHLDTPLIVGGALRMFGPDCSRLR